MRHDRAGEAARLLGQTVVITAELAGRLPRRAPARGRPLPHVLECVLDEVDVHRTLKLLEELDTELDHATRGCGAGRAGALADSLVLEIGDLTWAAASGRTRPRPVSRRVDGRARRHAVLSREVSPWVRS